jgi:hypothetical protein
MVCKHVKVANDPRNECKLDVYIAFLKDICSISPFVSSYFLRLVNRDSPPERSDISDVEFGHAPNWEQPRTIPMMGIPSVPSSPSKEQSALMGQTCNSCRDKESPALLVHTVGIGDRTLHAWEVPFQRFQRRHARVS